MSGPNHIAGGIVFTGIYLSMWNKNIFSQPHFLFFTAFFSLLPDIDHTKSIIGKPFYPISVYLDRKFGHRTLTHSLLFYFILLVCVSALEKITIGTNDITQIYTWAYGSHLILDMLTVQGIPLFYPFKKNPCVIPGNPKFRFRSGDFKTESMMFFIFLLLAFTCKDLFVNGFWNTYNRTWNSVKSLHTERLLTDKAISVEYDYVLNNEEFKGTGILVIADLSEAIIFDKRFLRVKKEDRIMHLIPTRTNKRLIQKELTFSNITFDSLQNLIWNKPILSLKIQAQIPIQFTKDNKPQSSTSLDLDYILNPVLQSQNIDSLDLTTAKEIELAKQELSNNEAQLKIYTAQKEQYQKLKSEAYRRYVEIQENINSHDLAIREKAIKEMSAAKNKYEGFNQINTEPINQANAINIKLKFLESKRYVKKTQSITGYFSYFVIN